MKKFSRIYKQWTALFLALLMTIQPVFTAFAETAGSGQNLGLNLDQSSSWSSGGGGAATPSTAVEAFTIDDVTIEGNAHVQFEKDLVLRLKEDYSWNPDMTLEAGDDFSYYGYLVTGQAGDEVQLLFEKIDEENALHLKARGTVVWGYQEEAIRIEANYLSGYHLICQDGQPLDGCVTNERNDQAVWDIEPLRVIELTWTGKEEDLPVKPDAQGELSGSFDLLLPEGYRFAATIAAGDVNESFGINLEDDRQTVTVDSLGDEEESGDRRRLSLHFTGTADYCREDCIEFHFWDRIEVYDQSSQSWNLISGEVKSVPEENIRWAVPAKELYVDGAETVTAGLWEEKELSFQLRIPDEIPMVWDEEGLEELESRNELTGYHFELDSFDGFYQFTGIEMVEESGGKTLIVTGSLNSGQAQDIPVLLKVRDAFRWEEGQPKAGEAVQGEFWTRQNENFRIIIGNPHTFRVYGYEDQQFDLWWEQKDGDHYIVKDQEYTFDPEAETYSIILRRTQESSSLFRGFYVYPKDGPAELYTIGSSSLTEVEEGKEYRLDLVPGNYRNGFDLEVITYELPYNGELIPCFNMELGKVAWSGTKDGKAAVLELKGEEKVYFDAHEAQTLTITPEYPERFFGVEVMYPEAAGSEENFTILATDGEKVSGDGETYTVRLFEGTQAAEPQNGFWLQVYWMQEEYEFEHQKEWYYRDQKEEDYYYIDIQNNGDTGEDSFKVKEAEKIGAILKYRYNSIRGLIPKTDGAGEARTSIDFYVAPGKWSNADIWINGEEFTDEDIADNTLTYQIPGDGSGNYCSEIDVDYSFWEKNTQWLFHIEDTEITGTAHTPLENQYLTLTIPQEDEFHVWKSGFTANEDLSDISEIENNNDRNQFLLKFIEYVDPETRKQIRVQVTGTSLNGQGEELRLILKNMICELQPGAGGEGTAEVMLTDQIRNFGNTNARWSVDNYRKIRIESEAGGFTVGRDADGKVRHIFTLTLEEGFRWIGQTELQEGINNGHCICSNLLEILPEGAERTETIQITSMSEDRRTITFSFVGETNYQRQDAIQFYCWDCVEKEEADNWALIKGEVANYYDEKILFNVPVLKKIVLDQDTASVKAGQNTETAFSFRMKLEESLGWNWDEESLEELAKDSNLYSAFELKDYEGYYEFSSYKLEDGVLELSGKLNSGKMQDVPLVIRAVNVFQKNGTSVYGELENAETAAHIIIGEPHKFRISGFNENYFKLWKGTEEDVEENLLHGGAELSYTEKTDGGFEEQKFTLRRENAQGVFRGVMLYPNYGDEEFYAIGAEDGVVSEKGNDVYEITLDPNRYLNGVSVRVYTDDFPYKGQFIPCFDGEKEDARVIWKEEEGEDQILTPGEYVNFTPEKSQTYKIQPSAEEGFYGIEVCYAQGGENQLILSTDERFTYDTANNIWSIELFDGETKIPESGYWLQVYWSREEYDWEHLTDGDWQEENVLVTVQVNSGSETGTVTADGGTGFSRYGETRYLVERTQMQSGLALTVAPAAFYKLSSLWIGEAEYAGQVTDNRLTWTDWNENDSEVNVYPAFTENRTDLGEHISIRDTRITAATGEEYTAHLYLTLDGNCGYTWAESKPAGVGEAIRINIPQGSEEAVITEWKVDEQDKKLLEVKLTGVAETIYENVELHVSVIRGLLDQNGAVEGGELYSHINSNALWYIMPERGITIKSGTSISGVNGVFTQPQTFVLQLTGEKTWAEDIQRLVQDGNIGANCAETKVEYVSVSADRKELTVQLSGKAYSGSETWPVVIWAGGGSILDGGQPISGQLATVEREDINWIIASRSGLTVDNVSLDAKAKETAEQTVVLKLSQESELTFDPDRFPQDPSELKNDISFNGNRGWWEFKEYMLSEDRRELTLIFDLTVPFKRTGVPLKVSVSSLISGNDGTMTTETNENAVWNIQRAGTMFGIKGASSPTGIRSGETKSFSIDRYGYEEDIKVSWSLRQSEESQSFVLTEDETDPEQAEVKAVSGTKASAVLVAEISYDYDTETKEFRNLERLSEQLYVKNSFSYENLEEELVVLEKNSTLHVKVLNPEELEITKVSWSVLPMEKGGADSRITVAPTQETEAVVKAESSTGSDYAQLEVRVEYKDLSGNASEETRTAKINVYDGEMNYLCVGYDANGGTGLVSSQAVKAGEAVIVREVTCTKSGACADSWIGEDGTVYWPGEELTPVSDMKLYANWTPNGWTLEGEDWLYYREGEKVCNEWVLSGTKYFWLGEDGKKSPDTRVEYNGFTFCTDETGAMVKNGWAVDAGSRFICAMYLNGNGVALGAFEEEEGYIGGKYYGFENGCAWADYVLTLQIDPETADENEDYTLYLLDGNPAGMKLPELENESYRLEGWYTEASGGTRVTDADLAQIKESCRLYAHWTALQTVDYTVIYQVQSLEDPESYQEAGSEILRGAVGDTTEVTAPVRPGFTAQTVQQCTIAESGTQVVVKYDRREYTLSFKMDDSGFPAVESKKYKYGEATDLPDAADYAKSGKTFLGWYSDMGKLNDGEGMPAFDVKLTPLWAEGENWTWDGIGWKYPDKAGLFGEEYLTDSFVGLPEADPTVWYYVDGYGHMLQRETLDLEDGIAAFGLDGKRLYSSWIQLTAEWEDVLYCGLTERWAYADRNGWLYRNTLKNIAGTMYGFDENGRMAVGYTDENFNILTGTDCVYRSTYYFNASGQKTLGSLYTDSLVDYTGDIPYEYRNYDRIWFYFGADGTKITGETKNLSGYSCSFDQNGVLSSGVTVTYRNGNPGEYQMDTTLIPAVSGVGGSICPNQYAYHGYTFDGWKAGSTSYTDGQALTAQEVKALYDAGGTLELTAQWKAVSWQIELPELEHASVKLAAGSNAATGSKVSFTVTPETGYHLDEGAWSAVELNWIHTEKQDDQGRTVPVELTKATAANTWSFTVPAAHVRVKTEASVVPDDSTAYTVKHYKQNLADQNYKLADTDNLHGKTGTDVTPAVRSYAGFTAPKTQTATVKADGSLVIEYYYTRNSYPLTLEKGTGIEGVSGAGTYSFEAAISVSASVKEGYTFQSWTKNGTVLAKESSFTYTMPAGDVQLKANASANSYTVKFHANGGTGTMADETFTYDAQAKTLTANTFTRTGYAFAGWALTESGEAVYTDGQAVRNLTAVSQGEVQLYAKWSAGGYTVRFDANGGTGTMADELFTYDAQAKALTANAFTRTGYHFIGWADMPDGEVKYADGALVRNLTTAGGSVIRIYAKWAANAYTVKFEANGGTGTMADQAFVYDAAQKALTTLGYRCVGYTFSGWAVDGGQQTYANRAKVKNLTAVENGTVRLVAQWTPNEDTAYKVEHRLQNLAGSGYELERTEGKYGTTDAQTAARAKNFEGFEAQNIVQKTIAADGSTVVEIRYDRKKYTLTFETEEGSIYTSQQVKYEGTAVKPADPEKENYVFAGWYQDPEGQTAWSFDDDVVTEDTSVYAKWTAKTKRLLLDAAGGTVTPTEKEVEFGGTCEGLPVPVRSGYGFGGWYTAASGGKLVNNLTEVTDTADQNLYAHWESGKYTVSFQAGEGSIVGGNDSKPVEYDGTYGELPEAEQKGYTFLGWFTQETGGTQITAATVVKTAADQKLYAHYEAKSYPITYLGIDGAENQNPESYTIEDQFFFNRPTKTGYVFAGWDMLIDGTAMGEKMMMAGIEKGTVGAVKLTAGWTEYKPQKNEVIQSSAVAQQANESEEVQKVAEEIAANKAAGTKTENLEKALDAQKLQELAKQEIGDTQEEVGSVEVHLEIKLENVTVETGTGEKKQTTLTFDVTPMADFKDLSGTALAENVPVSDDVLNNEERFTFRIPIPASITEKYAKVKHTTESGTVEESIHPILEDADGKYIEYSAKKLSPFELSFLDKAYVVKDLGTYTYTGSAICPEVEVKEEVSGTVLTEDVDYSVTYENNIQPTKTASRAKAIITILASGLKIEKEFEIEKKSEGGGGSSGGSSSSGGSAAVSMPSWVEKSGTWKQDEKGNWTYTNKGEVYKNKWACIYNPYANTKAGQRVYDWFRFDANGIMITGWFTDTDGNMYYLNPVSDGSRGRMLTGWQQIEGKWYCFSSAEGSGTMGALYRSTTTPDGYKVDAKGVWIQ